ncbi:PA2169 family four-helix-bundle protein [Erythrobacteraceae bacterium CFH 75059]|uniref:PA2169 family four-helix-bundle protein n=1 Tax=Qipengyuania thermophila TaxID=2509361 RepID=UPI00101F37DC|nr:PA2169 family four-helix-bundle protein [Qipengyuania thermophila]TCD05043.1 PA2169 family four-helix-bundle protein [Erythrobacteraceae bacterium CFH 75059]
MSASTTLKTLTDSVYDSIEGYRLAIEKAQSADLRSALQERLSKREQTLEALNAALQQQGSELVTKGTLTGELHRTWLKVADLFESGDAAAAERVEEGEGYLAKKFRAALEQDDLDPQERSVIERCFAEIQEGERFGDRIERQHG